MKPINEMTDQELAEAVAVEVLGWELDQGKWIQPVGDKFISAPESIAGYFGDRIDLNANFREAIEDELERRGLWHSVKYIPDERRYEATNFYLTVFHGNRYRAIAKAALMAVRGEGSHGKG